MTLSDPQLLSTFAGHRGNVTSVDINHKSIVSGSEDSSIQVWHLESSLRPYKYIGHKGRVYDVCFNPSGDLIASGSQDECVRL